MKDVLYPIIEHYIGTGVSNIKRDDDIVFFRTLTGYYGKIEKNLVGNWDLSINEEKMAEIEDTLFSIFCVADEQPPLDTYYKSLLDVQKQNLGYRSIQLVDELIASLEYLALNPNIQLKSPINLGSFYIFSHNGKKEIVSLN